MNLEKNADYSSKYAGLSPIDVKRSRKINGSNNLSRSTTPYVLRLIGEVVTEPMFILLAITCAIYLILGEYTEGIIMIIALLLVSGISIFQSIRSTNAVKALHALSQSKVKVIRENTLQQIAEEELVVDDLMIVEEGNIIPADAKIISSHDFSANESLLTGESYSVSKDHLKESNIYRGTQVASGYSLAKVVAVGDATQVGKLGLTMQEIDKVKTQLQQQIDHFVKNMALFGVIAFILVWIINYSSSKDFYQSLLQGLTLAMSALPEEIPVAFSTFMALGAWRLIRKKVLAKQPHTVESLGAASVICLDKTGTITENKMVVESIYDYQSKSQIAPSKNAPGQQVIQDAMLASEVEPFDPMETAIHSCYEAYATQNIRNKIQMIHEYPLAGQPPMMTHIYEDQHKKVYIAAKGSWEKIVQICQLPPEELALIKSAVAKMAARGLRILGTAHGENPVKDGYPKNQENFSWHFSGLIGLSDPPKKNISKVFDKFYEAGIQIKMITGDYPETAMAIAKQSGLKNNGQIAIGDEVMKMSGKELEALVRATNIFARMYPQAKLKVINTLRNLGEVVAMTGDGVNDGPALKAAEIGIAMGHRGTEIARNAADLILIDDDLGHMVDAIESGRKIYCNLKKAFRYIISIHIPIIMIVTVPLALGWKYPHIFSPIHVIFLELIMGPTCSIVYENEPVESHLMHTKPRALSESLFSWSELSVSILQGLVITICTLGLYQWATIAGESEDVVRTLTFSTLIFANIFLTLVNRSFEKSIFKTLQYKNALIPIIFVITLLIWAGSIHIEPIKALFQFEHINMVQIIYCIVAGALSVLWIEVIKWWRQKLETRELSAS